MYIHFAFGSLGKIGNTAEQTQKVVECILSEKRLRVSKCTEFLPVYPKKGSRRIPMDAFKQNTDDSFSCPIDLAEFVKAPEDNSIYYIQNDVPMICFINISFHSLPHSQHSAEYGKFGIVLSTEFLKKKGLRPVYYYTEESLRRDPLIKRWNVTRSKAEEHEILAYRKPATYFYSFKKSVQLLISRTESGNSVGYVRYERYPLGYDFTQEHEWRIAFQQGQDYMEFDEKDMIMIITPDAEARIAVDSYLKENWTLQPIVRDFPV